MRKLHAGLDVADKTTAICIVNESGEVVFQGTTETTPEAISDALKPYRRRLASVGQEAGTKASWLHKELSRAKLPIHSLDPWHTHSALNAKLNKTDANDARGIAVLLARGLYTSSFVKGDEATDIRVMLSLRESVVRKSKDLKSALRMANKLLGKEVPVPSRRRRLAARSDAADAAAKTMAAVRRMADAADEEAAALTAMATKIAKDHPLCARFMTIPGVGPITALTIFAAIDDPHRFKSSRDLGPYFGLTPRTYQSGQVSRSGGISHRGDRAARKALFMAARIMLLNSHSTCSLRTWGLRLAKSKGPMVAYVAVARKLGVLIHRLWVTGQDFDPAR